jgi:hypothetical protein
VLSASRVSRGVILLERDEFGELHSVDLEAAIVLARCPRCGTRTRVLPYDVLPYKRYSVAVITVVRRALQATGLMLSETTDSFLTSSQITALSLTRSPLTSSPAHQLMAHNSPAQDDFYLLSSRTHAGREVGLRGDGR